MGELSRLGVWPWVFLVLVVFATRVVIRVFGLNMGSDDPWRGVGHFGLVMLGIFALFALGGACHSACPLSGGW